MSAVIYRAIHLASGRCYIGHTTKWVARKKQHIGLLKKGTHHSPFLQHVWSKYGEDAFQFEVVETCIEEQKLVREQWWIDNTNSVFNYAKVAGSRKGVPQSAEAKEKVRQAHLGKKWSAEKRKILSLASMGKPGTRNGAKHSDASRAKMSASWEAAGRTGMLGKTHNPETIEKMSAGHKIAWLTRTIPGHTTPHSDEAKAKMRAAKLGRKQTPEQIAKRTASLAAFRSAQPPEYFAAQGRKISAAKRAKRELSA
jgi:hypothetical protein